MLQIKCPDDGRNIHEPDHGRYAEADRLLPGSVTPQFVLGIIQNPQCLADPAVKQYSCIRQLHPLMGTAEKMHPEFFLKTPDSCGYGRLGYVQVPGSRVNASEFCHADKILQLCQAHESVLSIN